VNTLPQVELLRHKNIYGEKMKLRTFFLLALVLVTPSLVGNAHADSILGSADSFAVLGGSTVTNAGAGVLGATVVTGDLGVSAGDTCTGFGTCPITGPGAVIGTVNLDSGIGVAATAQSNLTTAYTTLAAMSGTPVLGGTLGGLSLGPGVYTAPTLGLTGTLTLSDGGVAGSEFVFIAGSTLITAPNSSINVSGLSPSDSLYWVVESSATLGDNTVFEGNILALTSISFDPGATDNCGRALARNAAVTFAGQDATSLIENQVSIGCADTTGAGGEGFNGVDTAGAGGGTGTVPTPEPGTLVLLLSGIFPIGILKLRKLALKSANKLRGSPLN
jgi:hypothetical protein